MENEKVADVPYIVHEAEMARMERVNARLFWAWIVTLILLAGCVAGFIWYEAQWEVVETQVTQESETGYNNYIGNDGDIYNGQTNDQNAE